MALAQGSNPTAEATVELPPEVQTIEKKPFVSSTDATRVASAIQKIEFVFSTVDFVLPMRDSRNQKEEFIGRLFIR